MPLFQPESVKILSIGELTSAIKGTLQDGFSSVWVAGEISTLSRPASGHVYLTLKDAEAQIGAIIWRSVLPRVKFDLEIGTAVIARGGLSVYAPRGEYKLHLEEIQPRGMGARELALRQLKEKLQKLGYFDPKRKKPLPRFPRRIALVTSASGAAIRDMLEIIGRRWPIAEVWVCPSRVQGLGACQEVSVAIQQINRIEAVDVIIIGRGGGSADDLWAFNEEGIAHAIFHSRIPVVSAVGHEIDVTIADLVADFRAATPSEAAERATPDLSAMLDGLGELRHQLHARLTRRVDLLRARLTDVTERRAFRLPLERVRDSERRVDDFGERLHRSIGQRLSRSHEQLRFHAARLETLSPLNVLGRGYSLTRRASDRQVVRHGDDVRHGDLLVTQLQHGEILSRVEPITNDTSAR
jgi:exodeoxyribonuclease VII large subunit